VQLLPPSHPLTKAGAWTKYHLAVTRRKDSEPRSVASRYDTYIPGKPFVSLDDFIDGMPHIFLETCELSSKVCSSLAQA
jgi:Copper amine oxidase, enzyme domain